MNSAEAAIATFLIVMCLSMAITAGITPELINEFRLLCELVIYIASVGVVNLVSQGGFNIFGISPRTPIGLLGILLAPFLHGSWNHLIGNIIIFFILGWFVMLGGAHQFFIVTVFIGLVSGFGTWLLGRAAPPPHIGASGVIFGYIGFLIVRGYFGSNSLSAVLSAVVGGVYGRLIRGILPTHASVSWESHLFGLIGGVLAASYLDVLKAMFPAF